MFHELHVVLIGILIGFTLIDLAFDLECFNKNFQNPLQFYTLREKHRPLNRFLTLQLPLVALILFTVGAVIQKPILSNMIAMVLIVAANFCGNVVINQRKKIVEILSRKVEKDPESDPGVQGLLTTICLAHLAMLPLLSVGFYLGA